MSVHVEVKVDDSEVKEFFDGIEERIMEAIKDEIYIHLIEVRNLALRIKPWTVRTGQLTSSHFIEEVDGGYELYVDTTINNSLVNKKEEYGHLLEYGSSHNRPYPWIHPAFKTKEPEIVPRLARAINNAIKGKMPESKAIMEGNQDVPVFSGDSSTTYKQASHEVERDRIASNRSKGFGGVTRSSFTRRGRQETRLRDVKTGRFTSLEKLTKQ